MCPHFILSHNGTEFKNQLMDNVLKQLVIDHIFSVPYQPQINGELEVFNKYLIPALKKLCENDPDNWDNYSKQVLASYCVTPHLAAAGTPFFLSCGRDPDLPLHQLLESMQWFMGDPESGCLDLEPHCLALAIAKNTWMRTYLNTHKRQQTALHLVLKLVTKYTLKISNLENGI